MGIDDFKTVIEKNYYFVDKSKLIEDIIADGAIVKFFCRPIRFGKTLNMSMIKYFFDIRERERRIENFLKAIYRKFSNDRRTGKIFSYISHSQGD